MVQPQVGCLQQVRPNIGIAPSKPPDVHIGREVETPPAQSGIGVIQLVDCELHDRIMTGNWVWLVEVRGYIWPILLKNSVFHADEKFLALQVH